MELFCLRCSLPAPPATCSAGERGSASAILPEETQRLIANTLIYRSVNWQHLVSLNVKGCESQGGRSELTCTGLIKFCPCAAMPWAAFAFLMPSQPGPSELHRTNRDRKCVVPHPQQLLARAARCRSHSLSLPAKPRLVTGAERPKPPGQDRSRCSSASKTRWLLWKLRKNLTCNQGRSQHHLLDAALIKKK